MNWSEMWLEQGFLVLVTLLVLSGNENRLVNHLVQGENSQKLLNGEQPIYKHEQQPLRLKTKARWKRQNIVL